MVTLTIVRGGKTMTVDVTLGAAPTSAPTPTSAVPQTTP